MNAKRVMVSGRPEASFRASEGGSQSVYLTGGAYAGEATDWILLPDSTVFAAVEISPGPVYRLFGCCAYASDFQPGPEKNSVSVPRLLTWTQLRRQLGEEEDG